MNAKSFVSKARSSSAAVALPGVVLTEVRSLIIEARHQAARTVDAGLTLLYWHVGHRILREILGLRSSDCRHAVATIGLELLPGDPPDRERLHEAVVRARRQLEKQAVEDAGL